MLNSKENLDLDIFRWKNRLLLIFAPNSRHTKYRQQIGLFEEQKAEFANRDLLTFHLFDNEPGRLNQTLLAAEAATAAKERFNIQSGEFTLILVGKDGGVKLRANRPTHPVSICNLIDLMPHREQVLRRQRQKQ